MSPILEVLIGLIFIFSLLSILVTQINAIIAQALRLRSRYLFDTVKELIHDPELTARFMTHPLIKMIDFSDIDGMEKWEVILPTQNLDKEQADHILKAGIASVDWIDSKTFSSVLLSLISVKEDSKLFTVLDDIAVQMDNDSARRDVRRKINDVVTTGHGIDDLISTINELPPSAHKKALIDRLRDISKEIGDKGLKTDINVSVMAGVQYIKDQYLKNAINTILTTSKTLEEVEAKITKWYDDSTYKTTELFKRHMKWYSYLIGLVIAIFINVDTIYISLKLWEDPVIRSAVAEAASNVSLEELQSTLDEANDGINSDEAATAQGVLIATDNAAGTIDLLLDSRVPIGWDYTNLSAVLEANPNDLRLRDSHNLWNLIPGNNPNWLWMFGTKIIGIVATMLAIGQGAPFWFNLLRQFR